MLCNYMAHVCLTKRNIMQKIRHVFYDIHYLTEVIQFVNFPQCRTDEFKNSENVKYTF